MSTSRLVLSPNSKFRQKEYPPCIHLIWNLATCADHRDRYAETTHGPRAESSRRSAAHESLIGGQSLTNGRTRREEEGVHAPCHDRGKQQGPTCERMSAPRFGHAWLAQQEWNRSWQGQRQRPHAGRNVETMTRKALTVCGCAELRRLWRFCLSRAQQEHEDWTLASTSLLRSQFGLRCTTTTSSLEETTESMSGTHNEIRLEQVLSSCLHVAERNRAGPPNQHRSHLDGRRAGSRRGRCSLLCVPNRWRADHRARWTNSLLELRKGLPQDVITYRGR